MIVSPFAKIGEFSSPQTGGPNRRLLPAKGFHRRRGLCGSLYSGGKSGSAFRSKTQNDMIYYTVIFDKCQVVWLNYPQFSASFPCSAVIFRNLVKFVSLIRRFPSDFSIFRNILSLNFTEGRFGDFADFSRDGKISSQVLIRSNKRVMISV